MNTYKHYSVDCTRADDQPAAKARTAAITQGAAFIERVSRSLRGPEFLFQLDPNTHHSSFNFITSVRRTYKALGGV
jgi:sialic acid synthase SpsE